MPGVARVSVFFFRRLEDKCLPSVQSSLSLSHLLRARALARSIALCISSFVAAMCGGVTFRSLYLFLVAAMSGGNTFQRHAESIFFFFWGCFDLLVCTAQLRRSWEFSLPPPSAVPRNNGVELAVRLIAASPPALELLRAAWCARVR